MVFTMWWREVGSDEPSDECSMGEIKSLMEAGTITDATPAFVDGMDDWGVFGAIKDELDWDEQEASPGFTSMYYSTGEGEGDMSDELNMEEVMRLYDADVITDATMVYCDGMDGWLPFEQAKYSAPGPARAATRRARRRRASTTRPRRTRTARSASPRRRS